MIYLQIWWVEEKGFFYFFMKYIGVWELYFEISRDGLIWIEDQKLVGIKGLVEEKGGYYQVSYYYKDKVVIFFS